jgi:DNA gyrase subunit B
VRCIDWTLASSPEFRQMMSKYTLIKEFLEPPFLIEYAAKAAAVETGPEVASEAETEDTAPDSAEVQAEAKQARRTARILREPVEKQTARELFAYIVEQGKKDYSVQRYKGLGEMSSTQLWETTMDPERRTLLSVKLEDFVEAEEIFATLMGEDVEKRRKFIEDNALNVRNLDI